MDIIRILLVDDHQVVREGNGLGQQVHGGVVSGSW